MKPAPFDYVRAASLEDAARRLSSGPNALAIAGGQSLTPMLALRVASPDVLVDISDVAALRLAQSIPGGARIGAGISHAEIEDGEIPDPTDGFMQRVAAGIAYRSVRNHGTIGGSVALADPAADWPTCLLALGAIARIATPGGERTEPIDDFLRGAYTTSLQPGEIITAFDVLSPGVGSRFGWVKVVRKSGAFAMSLGGVVLSAGGVATVALGGTTTRPMLMKSTAEAAGGGEAAQRSAIAADLAVAAPDADDYQRRLHTATLLRALREATA